MSTTVYTDGACAGNPGPGGWAWAVPSGRYQSGAEAQSTNQRMEIKAVLEALRSLDGPVHVISDSTYVVHCFRDKWWEGWLRRGWTNSAKKPVANRDLWEPLIDLYRSRENEITFEWVKGHSEDAINDIVDRLAVAAAQLQEGQSGVGTPSDLGPADVPGLQSGGARDLRLPSGHLIWVTGHRPDGLGGYGDNPVADRVLDQLTEILSAKKAVHPDAVVLTGLGLGSEQLAAKAAESVGMEYVGVLAFPDPDTVWPAPSKQTFRDLLSKAATTVVLNTNAPKTKQQAGMALGRRDEWMASNSDELIVIWDEQDTSLAKLVAIAERRLDEVWVIDPNG